MPTAATATAAVQSSGGKPDSILYKSQQKEVSDKIKVVQDQDTIKLKISSLSTPASDGSGSSSKSTRSSLRDEFNALKDGKGKGRSALFDQMKSLQESVQSKITALKASKSKSQFATPEDVDAQIADLNAAIESGSLRVAEEKKVLLDISKLKQTRKLVEKFQEAQGAIDADRARIDSLKAQLDDPEAQAVKARMDELRAQMDALKTKDDKLYDQRNALMAQLDELYSQKKAAMTAFREANDQYYNKMTEDRNRRQEKFKAQKELEDKERKRAVAEQLREDAETPAYTFEIQDCTSLAEYLAKLAGGSAPAPPALESDKALENNSPSALTMPKLELRKVEDVPIENGIELVKKSDREEDAWIGGLGRKKGKKHQNGTHTPKENTSAKLSLPFNILSGLSTLSIPPPLNHADLSKTVENLYIKRAWFQANQARVTAEAKAKAEKEIAKYMESSSADQAENGAEKKSEATASEEVAPAS